MNASSPEYYMPAQCSRLRSRTSLRAFTLVELLVVIGIIVILVGLLFGGLALARRSGGAIRQAADLQAIATGLEQYKADHGFYPPVEFRSASDPDSSRHPFVIVSLDKNASPRIESRPSQTNGSIVLTQALFGLAYSTDRPGFVPATSGSPGTMPYIDGHDGPGFRTRTLSGLSPRTYGPYLQVDRFRIDNIILGSSQFPVVVDANGKPILYIPATRGSGGILTNPNSFVGRQPANASTDRPFYQLEPAIIQGDFRTGTQPDGMRADQPDGLGKILRRAADETIGTVDFYATTITRVRRMLGERKQLTDGSLRLPADGGTDVDIFPGGRPKYLLWAAGPDGKFFPDQVDPPSSPTAEQLRRFYEAYEKCDDVTNFRGAGQ